jgi:hypothetical protein
VRNNESADSGGGFYIYGPTPTVTNTLFENNHADVNGGGTVHALFLNAGPHPCGLNGCVAVYDNCTFRNNTAMHGGGLLAFYSARLLVTGSLFDANYASYESGGIHMTGINTTPDDPDASRALVSGCTFLGNGAAGFAGALTATNATNVTVVRSDFVGNTSAGHAGAMRVSTTSRTRVFNSRFIGNRTLPESPVGDGGTLVVAGELMVANTVFAGGSSKGNGGVIKAHPGAAIQIANSTFMRNTSGLSGSVLSNSGGSVQLVNAIVWDSAPAPFVGSIDVSYSAVEGGWPGAGNITTDPQFVDPLGLDGLAGTEDDDLRLWPDSPAVNAAAAASLPPDVGDLDGDGNISEPIPLDLNDDLRIYGAGVDMGALETSVIPCNPGTFSATGEQPCTPCSPGTAQPNSGATQCAPCAPGTIAPAQGATVCSPCPPETYQPAVGAIACLPCDCDDSNACTTNGCNAASGACENQAFCTVPAASAWALLVMSLMLAIAGTIVIAPRGFIAVQYAKSHS